MKDRKSWVERIAQETNLQGEAFPGESVVELFSDRRILIEHHRGVIFYSDNEIKIHLKFGILRLCGCKLELNKVSHQQLVITGRIDEIHIIRGAVK